MYCSLPGSSLHGISQARILSWLPFPFPGDLPDLTCIAGRFFTTEPPGKSKIKRLKEHKRANLRDNTGVQGSQCNSAFKESTCNAGDPRFDSWVGKIPWRRNSLPIPVFLPAISSWTEEPGEPLSMESKKGRHD